MVVVNSAEKIADLLEQHFRHGGADGFNILAPTFPDSLADFVELVIPILQERKLFRSDYEGCTLREHLELPSKIRLSELA